MSFSDVQTGLCNEIIRKQYSRYKLEQCGFPREQDVLLRIPEFTAVTDYDFASFEKAVSEVLYDTIGYSEYILEHKNPERSDSLFGDIMRGYTEDRIKVMYSKDGGSSSEIHTCMNRFWDNKHFQTQSRSIAYFLTTALFHKFYTCFSEQDKEYRHPSEAERFFEQAANANFPLEFNMFMAQLAENDRELWEFVGLMIKKLSAAVTNQRVFAYKDRGNASGTVTSEAYIKIYEDFPEKLRHKYKDPEHFIKGISLYCMNMTRTDINSKTRDKSRFTRGDDSTWLNVSGANHNENTDLLDRYLDIDLNDDEEVLKLALLAAELPDHPLHQMITKDGWGSKIELMMKVKIDKKHYNEIIDELYPDKKIPDGERKKVGNRLRKECDRTMDALADRMRNILKDLRKLRSASLRHDNMGAPLKTMKKEVK